MNLDQVFLAMLTALQKASRKVFEISKRSFTIEIKEDQSPVTEADFASNQIIKNELKCFPIAWLSEEDSDSLSRLEEEYVFVVDPLDGTEDFVKRDGSYGINLALVKDHRVIIGMVACPERNLLCYARENQGTILRYGDGREERIHVSTRKDHLRAFVSKTHFDQREEEALNRHKDLIEQVIPLGACNKALELARGNGEICLRYTDKTKEWDVCAPDLIVREAGGIFVDTLGKPFVYNRKDVYNRNGYFMANCVENERIFL